MLLIGLAAEYLVRYILGPVSRDIGSFLSDLITRNLSLVIIIVAGTVLLEVLGVPVLGQLARWLESMLIAPVVAWLADAIDWAMSGFESWFQGVIEQYLSSLV